MLDYISVTNRFKFLRAWLGEDVKALGTSYSVSEQEKSEVVARYRGLSEGAEGATCQAGLGGKIPFRLKQLLIPKDDDYVAVTPLPCLPVGNHLKTGFGDREQRAKELRNEAKKKSVPKSEQDNLKKQASAMGQIASLSNYPVGGANAQNVGGRIFEAYTRPILCRGLPRMDPDLKKAFSIAYRGVRFRLPRGLVEEYQKFLDHQLEKSGGSGITWTSRIKEAEADHLNRLFDTWERQAEAGQRLLEVYRAELPEEIPSIDSEGAESMRGWLKPQTRTPKWLDAEVRTFARDLQRFVIAKSSTGDPITLQLTSADVTRIRAALLERRSA
jgi:hypothetical protein